jgi:hypothetical protein
MDGWVFQYVLVLSASVFVSLPLYLCLLLCMSPSLSLSASASLFLSVSLYVSFFLCLALSLSVSAVIGLLVIEKSLIPRTNPALDNKRSLSCAFDSCARLMFKFVIGTDNVT